MTYEDTWLHIRRPTIEDMPALNEIAQRGNEACVVYPTHVLEKGGKVAGCVSFGVIPTALMWLDKDQLKARDTLMLMNFLEHAATDRGAPGLLVPAHDGSTLQPYGKKIGYYEWGHGVFLGKLFPGAGGAK